MEINSLSNVHFVNLFDSKLANSVSFSIRNTTDYEATITVRHTDAAFDDQAALKTLVLQPGETAPLAVPLFGPSSRFYVICNLTNGARSGAPFEVPLNERSEFSAEIRESSARVGEDFFPPVETWVAPHWVIVS